MSLKILSIPFAGGNKYSYNSFKESVPVDAEWIPLELPGRGERHSESFLTDVKEAREDLYQQALRYIQDPEVKYVIYGHSLGSLLGYELAKKIQSCDIAQPQHLFFTGREAPRFSSVVTWINLPINDFWEKINKMGGVPEAFLESKELQDFFYPILFADFTLINNYRYNEETVKLKSPMTVFIGTEEINNIENKCSLEKVEAWRNESQEKVEIEFMDGGHFFIFDYKEKIVSKMLDALNA